MRNISDRLAVAAAFVITSLVGLAAHAENDIRFYDGRYNEYYDGRGFYGDHGQKVQDETVQLGPRPYYLVEGLDAGKLKDRLKKCENGPFYRSVFSIGHRGAALQFPEHTKEAYQAGARMGAGIVECDVTFTKEGDLVCRHAECDLHTTTNIVTTPLNAKCSVPWTGPGSSPKCCTSDLTLSEFRTLKGKMDASNPLATTAEGFLGGTPNWRTDLYTGRGTLMTLRESIQLNEKNGVQAYARAQRGRCGADQSNFRQPSELRAENDQRIHACRHRSEACLGSVVQQRRHFVLASK